MWIQNPQMQRSLGTMLLTWQKHILVMLKCKNIFFLSPFLSCLYVFFQINFEYHQTPRLFWSLYWRRNDKDAIFTRQGWQLDFDGFWLYLWDFFLGFFFLLVSKLFWSIPDLIGNCKEIMYSQKYFYSHSQTTGTLSTLIILYLNNCNYYYNIKYHFFFLTINRRYFGFISRSLQQKISWTSGATKFSYSPCIHKSFLYIWTTFRALQPSIHFCNNLWKSCFNTLF